MAVALIMALAMAGFILKEKLDKRKARQERRRRRREDKEQEAQSNWSRKSASDQVGGGKGS